MGPRVTRVGIRLVTTAYGRAALDALTDAVAGAKAAVATIRLSSTPSEAMIREIAGLTDQVIHVSAKPA